MDLVRNIEKLKVGNSWKLYSRSNTLECVQKLNILDLLNDHAFENDKASTSLGSVSALEIVIILKTLNGKYWRNRKSVFLVHG